jgi:6-pyruvoyl-tetrahydropterin synthase
MQMTRHFKFYASHRNQLLQDKCACLHGHRYQVEYLITVGRSRQHSHHVSVLFADLDGLHEPVRSILDHSCMLDIADPLLPMMKKFVAGDVSGEFWKLVEFALPTSAENLAFFIFHAMNQICSRDGRFRLVTLDRVMLRETDSSVVEYTRDDLVLDQRRFSEELNAAGFLFRTHSKDSGNVNQSTEAPAY